MVDLYLQAKTQLVGRLCAYVAEYKAECMAVGKGSEFKIPTMEEIEQWADRLLRQDHDLSDLKEATAEEHRKFVREHTICSSDPPR